MAAQSRPSKAPPEPKRSTAAEDSLLPEEFGPRLTALRKRFGKMTQTELGDGVGVSQARISRLEKDENWPPDARLLAQIAKVFEMRVHELVPEAALAQLFTSPDEQTTFYAFCPNPFCKSNKYGWDDEGTACIWWSSGKFIDSDQFDRTNFCKRCGEKLVKDCPSCGRLLDEELQRYCGACGECVNSRPTSEESQRIHDERKVPEREPVAEDDIPF